LINIFFSWRTMNRGTFLNGYHTPPPPPTHTEKCIHLGKLDLRRILFFSSFQLQQAAIYPVGDITLSSFCSIAVSLHMLFNRRLMVTSHCKTCHLLQVSHSAVYALMLLSVHRVYNYNSSLHILYTVQYTLCVYDIDIGIYSSLT